MKYENHVGTPLEYKSPLVLRFCICMQLARLMCGGQLEPDLPLVVRRNSSQTQGTRKWRRPANNGELQRTWGPCSCAHRLSCTHEATLQMLMT